jgi:uncharacterized protein (TIGR03084 family)
MTDLMAEICDDLAAEKADLVAMLADLDAAQWELATPAEGWAVRDQVAHLAFFDEKALQAHEDPDGFIAELADVAALMEGHLDRGRAMAPGRLLAWWAEANSALIAAYRELDPAAKVVWYGPPMAARSKITARLMETWAHGQDVVDALGIVRAPTSRLRHVCHIGVRARPYAFSVNGLAVSGGDVRVELTAPDGATWTWGDSGAADRVTGTALGFALLVTQRRHRADVDLTAEGDGADRWLGVAQAFAGPPGPGRAPGQFARP